jgi:hypothetical protein
LEDGTSGFIVDTLEQAAAAARRISSVDRAKVRAAFERRFTVERMAHDYVEIYRTIAETRAEAVPAIRQKSKLLPSRATPKLAGKIVPTGAGNASRREAMHT